MLKSTTFNRVILLFTFNLLQFFIFKLSAQTASTSDNLIAQPVADRPVPFDITDPGISKTIEFGADLAWANEQAFRRNILFMGLDQIDIVRASFQPTYPLVNDTDLTQEQIDDLNYRLSLIDTYVGPNTDLALNCDHPSVDPYYVGYPARWEQLIEVSTRAFNDAGHNVITVGAFNEPDYGWGQGSAQDMYDITALLAANPYFSGVRLSGGNTLNCDEAQGWYDFLVPAGVNEGNTHQLAGSFDGYASFIENVRANGHHATLDELHNIGEALVGYEYGMQTGIWWADIDYASGEMVKAFDGQRIGYAEHRPNWTSAAVYRSPEGKVQAFGGTSERQAVTTTFNYISKDRAVYYDGHGPSREFVLEMPGGTGYATGQTNAERVINITWGDDIQPVIDGRYILVNRNSGQVMQVDGSTSQDGTNITEGSYSGGSHQQWDVYPVDSRVGGDFSYFKIQPASNNLKYLDLVGFSLDNGGNIQQWSEGQYGNQQWYLDYAQDNYFYIRSRESSKCIEVDATGNIAQWEKNGGFNQQWRLLPVGAPIEFVAPSAPTNLVATAQSSSIKLDWTASPESDVAGYDILRAESAGGVYNTIARNVSVTSFVDNTTLAGQTYYYTVRAEDQSLNRSGNSSEVSAAITGAAALVAHYNFENNTTDASENLNNAATYGAPGYAPGYEGAAISLDGTDDFVQLSADIASHQEITVATWIYYNGGSQWQRIVDFGNGTDEYMFLTPNSSTGGIQYGTRFNGAEENLYGPAIPTGTWTHVALTLGANGGALYVDGQLIDTNSSLVIRPADFKPVMNYIGRSQFSDPTLNASVDDFRLYNYALSASEIADLASVVINTAPSVTISNPTNGSEFNEGSTVTIAASAADTDGSISQVEFFVDGVSVGTDTTSPYSVDWIIGLGTYTLTAVATDNDALTTTSDSISVSSIVIDFHQFQNRGTGLFLDGLGSSLDGSDAGQVVNGDTDNARWDLANFDGTYYNIVNRATGMYLDGMGRTADGATCGQWLNSTNPNAQWEIIPVEGDYYQLKNRSTGLFIDGMGQVTDGSVYQWANTAHVNSQWLLIGDPITPPSDDPFMAVESILTGTSGAGQGNKYGTAQVTILDDQSNPVIGATVYGTFSGSWNESASGVTNGNGVAYIQTSTTLKGGVTVNFCVDDVTYSSLTYDATQNQITCTWSSAKTSKSKVESSVENTEFKLYPNPTSQYVTITLGMELVEMNLIDVNGRLVQTKMAKIGDKQYQLDMSNLTPGIYLLNVKTSESQTTKKVIKL